MLRICMLLCQEVVTLLGISPWPTRHVLFMWHDSSVGLQECFSRARLVLTIHNMDNSGECRQDEFGVTGIAGGHDLILLHLCSAVHSGVLEALPF